MLIYKYSLHINSYTGFDLQKVIRVNSFKEVLDILKDPQYKEKSITVNKFYKDYNFNRAILTPWSEDGIRSIDACTNWDLMMRLLNGSNINKNENEDKY